MWGTSVRFDAESGSYLDAQTGEEVTGFEQKTGAGDIVEAYYEHVRQRNPELYPAIDPTRRDGEPLPYTRNNIPRLIDLIKSFDSVDPQTGRADTKFLKTVRGLNPWQVLMSPELIQKVQADIPERMSFAEKIWDPDGEGMRGALTAEEYDKLAIVRQEGDDTPDSVIRALTYGTTADYMAAVFDEIPSKGVQSVDPTEQPSMAGLMDLMKNKVPPSIREYTWSIASTLPAGQSLIGNAIGVGIASQRSAPSAVPILGPAIDFFNAIGIGGGTGQLEGSAWRNYREEYATEMFDWLSANPLETPEDEKMFAVYAWKVAEKYQDEIAGREGHLGFAGDVLDIGKMATTNLANRGINAAATTLSESRFRDPIGPLKFTPPTEFVNPTHRSIGNSIAYGMFGMDEGNSGPGWTSSDGGRVLANIVKYAPLNITPFGLGLTIAKSIGRSVQERSFQVDLAGTPIWSPTIEGLSQSRSVDLVSGTFDFLSWIYLDPVNYLANAGFGVKAGRSMIRPEQFNRAQLAWRAAIPFFGQFAGASRGPATARIASALVMRSADEAIDLLRTSERGRRIFREFARADGPEGLMKSIRGLENNSELSTLLWRLSQDGKTEEFWETWRAAMHGGLDKMPAKNTSVIGNVIRKGDDLYHGQVQDALRRGKVGIRDVMVGPAGVQHKSPYQVVRGTDVRPRAIVDRAAEGFYNEGVTERQLRKGPRLAGGDVVKTVDIKGGQIEIRRGANGSYAAFENGEYRGMVENVSSPNRQVSVLVEHRERGIGSALRNIEGPQPRALDVSGSAETFYRSDAPTVVRASETVGDGTEKVVFNSKNGWSEIDATSDKLFTWLAENGHEELAARLQDKLGGIADYGEYVPVSGLARPFRLSDLSEDEIRILNRYLDDFTDGDALTFGDEMLLAKRSRRKMLIGQDLAEQRQLTDVLFDESLAQATNYMLKQVVAGGGHDQLTLVHQMPRYKKPRNLFRAMSSQRKIAQKYRRDYYGITNMAPKSIRFTNRVEGGNDLRRWLNLLGVSEPTKEKIMNRWWSAQSDEARRTVAIEAQVQAGNDLGDAPHLQLELIDHAKQLTGESGYGNDKFGNPIGLATDGRTGLTKEKPIVRSMFEDELPLYEPRLYNKEVQRFRRTKHLPKTIVNGMGFTGTRARREAIAERYRVQLRAIDPEHYLLEPKNADVLMQYAYADVIGFGSRETGLSAINRVTQMAGKAYSAFHSMFTISQLAFRPFPWAGRVQLEEHVRAWMMNLPTLYNNPTQYGFTFWDAHWIRAMPKRIQKQELAAANDARIIFDDKVTDVGKALDRADEVLPGFKNKIEAAGKTDVNEIRAVYSSQLYHALIGTGEFDVANRSTMMRRSILRSKRIRNVGERLEERYNLKLDFDFTQDAAEMMNKSNTWYIQNELPSSIKPLTWSPTMRQREVPFYADGWSKKAQQIVNDGGGQYALRRLEQRVGDLPVTADARGFTRKHYWHEVRENVKDVYRYRYGDDAAANIDEIGLAEFYLDELLIDGWIETLFGELWKNSAADKQRIVAELTRSKQVTVDVATQSGTRSHVLDLRHDRYGESKLTNRRFFDDANSNGEYAFPQVMAYVHPGMGQGPGFKNIRPVRRFTNKILQVFGEDVSQVLHRQPTYLFERRRWTKTLKNLGWDDADATAVAHQKALEMVNYTFFNNQHTGYIVNRMNRAIPFFGAWAEVMSTWAYKIPKAYYLPLGYAKVGHSMDKVMQGFVKMGLVDVDDGGQWHLNMSEDPDTLNPLGQGFSKGLHEWVRAPITILEHTANIARAFAEDAGVMEDGSPLDLSEWAKANYSFAIGSPVAINSHGIMGVNQVEFGPGPIGNFAATSAINLIRQLPFAADMDRIDSVGNLQEAFDALPSDVAPSEFLELNEDVLRAELGPEKYDLLTIERGWMVDAESYDVSGLSLKVPNSSIFDTWLGEKVDNLFFPFGHVETAAGIIRQLMPSTVSYMFRGTAGIFIDESEAPPGWVTAMIGPMEDYQMQGEIARAILHLESTEGLVTRSYELATRLNDLTQMAELSPEQIAAQGIDGDIQDEIGLVEHQLEMADDELMKRATDIAGWSTAARGFMGFFSAATPRMQHAEEAVKGQWYGTREMAKAATDGTGSVILGDLVGEMEVRTSEDIERIMLLVDGWLKDETGSRNKRIFKEWYPHLLAWTNPTTYWGPGGAPPEQQGLDKDMEDIEAGRRKVYSPGMLVQRVARTAVAAGHESELVARFGNDPDFQITAVLENWGEYSDLMDKRTQKYFALDLWDETMNDGEYQDWRERNAEESFVFYEYMQQQLDAYSKAGDELTMMVDLVNVDPADEKTFNIVLNKTLREYGDAVRSLIDGVRDLDPEWTNRRQEGIAEYFATHYADYHLKRQEIFSQLEDATNAQERGMIFEQARDWANKEYTTDWTIELGDGTVIPVPNELDRQWTMLSREQQLNQIQEWTTQPVEWLGLHSIAKIVEQYPEAAAYLPQSEDDMAPYTQMTREKMRLKQMALEHPEQISTYELGQEMDLIEEKFLTTLGRQHRDGEIIWYNAWPIERLVMTGQWPSVLDPVAKWYAGFRNELDALGVGPTSQAGRDRFNNLYLYLVDDWFPRNEPARDAFKELGKNLFQEGTEAAIITRLYGMFVGEVS